MTQKQTIGLGLALAIFLACAFSSNVLAGHETELAGSAEGSGEDRLLRFSTFWDEHYKAISTSASVLDGKVRSQTLAFSESGDPFATSVANADGYLSDTDSFTYVDGSHVGTIATASIKGPGSVSASSRVVTA